MRIPDVSARLGHTKRRLVDAWRAGGPPVIWGADQKMGFGNFAYLWLAAHVRESALPGIRVRDLPGMEPWLRAFPAIAQRFSAPTPTIPRRAHRIGGFFQGFDEEYTAEQLEGFIRRYLLPAPALQRAARPDTGEVLVNVRRGDYYSVPEFRGNYSFDIAAYVAEALALQQRIRPIERITVVSDGIDWCRLKLAWMEEIAPVAFRDGLGPIESLREIAGARRLVLANSTYSYWAGYISGVLHGDNHAEIVAPWFHERGVLGGRAYQHDPRWSVVEEIPGGWDA